MHMYMYIVESLLPIVEYSRKSEERVVGSRNSSYRSSFVSEDGLGRRIKDALGRLPVTRIHILLC